MACFDISGDCIVPLSSPSVPTGKRGPVRRPFQFGIRQLLLFTLGFAVVLGFHLGMYPYSTFGILVLPVSVPLSMIVFAWSRERSLWLTKCVTVNAIAYVLVTLLSTGCVDPSEPWRRRNCADQLKQIDLALRAYHHRYGRFPPAYVADAHGRRMHSWRVLILPFLDSEEAAWYAQYRFDEAWDGPHNRVLASRPVRAFRCPEVEQSDSLATSYVAVVGAETAWPGSVGRNAAEFSDGTSQTILLVEVADSGIPWMEPRDLEFATLPMSIQPQKGRGISSLHRDGSFWNRPLGAHVCLADGHVEFLGPATPAKKIRALLTIAGGEPIQDGD